MSPGRRRAIAFVAGWLLAIAVIGAIAVFVLHGQDFSSHKTTIGLVALMVIGAVLIGRGIHDLVF
jgi:hypothetical protein